MLTKRNAGPRKLGRSRGAVIPSQSIRPDEDSVRGSDGACGWALFDVADPGDGYVGRRVKPCRIDVRREGEEKFVVLAIGDGAAPVGTIRVGRDQGGVDRQVHGRGGRDAACVATQAIGYIDH